MMRYKEKWAVQIPANLAFGSAGRKASAGKPRIPGGADLYALRWNFVAFPGFEGDVRSSRTGGLLHGVCGDAATEAPSRFDVHAVPSRGADMGSS